MINPFREAINRSREFKFDFSSQLWLMNPPQTDFRFLSARNLPRPRYRIPPFSPLGEKYFVLGKEEEARAYSGTCVFLGNLEVGLPPAKMISTTFRLPFPLHLHPFPVHHPFSSLSLSLSFSYIPLVPRIFGTLNPFPLPTIPPHANQPLGFKSGSSLLLINLRISEFIGAIGVGMN